jgi:transglutaminase-like putative cysteine protease
MSVFKIHHITKYKYDRYVSESINEIRIFPYQCASQEVLQHDVLISNNPSIHIYKDYWGNRAGIFNVLESHQELVIESKLTIRTLVENIDLSGSNGNSVALEKEVENNLALIELTKPDNIQFQDKIYEIGYQFFNQEDSIKSIVEKCSHYVFSNYTYTKGITTIETTIDEILSYKKGVCQDFAHLLLQILRTMNIPSRYVSGYICPNKDGMRGEGATHAWVEVWLPNTGWAGIDPTNNVWVSNLHVKLAVGRNFEDCSVAKGSFKGLAKQDLFVFVSVGYEDGHIFEETTQVQLEKQNDEDNLVDVQKMAALAQQQ